MAKYGSVDLVINVDDSLSAAQDISEYVASINGIEIEALIEEITAFGDDWTRHEAVGIKEGKEVVLEGWFDDAAGGPNAVFEDSEGDTRTVAITIGGANTRGFEGIVTSYFIQPVNKELTKFTAKLLPTGAIT